MVADDNCKTAIARQPLQSSRISEEVSTMTRGATKHDIVQLLLPKQVMQKQFCCYTAAWLEFNVIMSNRCNTDLALLCITLLFLQMMQARTKSICSSSDQRAWLCTLCSGLCLLIASLTLLVPPLSLGCSPSCNCTRSSADTALASQVCETLHALTHGWET